MANGFGSSLHVRSPHSSTLSGSLDADDFALLRTTSYDDLLGDSSLSPAASASAALSTTDAHHMLGSSSALSGSSAAFTHFAHSSWGGFGSATSGGLDAGAGSGGDGPLGPSAVGGGGMDVAAAAAAAAAADRELLSDADADFAHNHPALSFLAE